jgi:hypothetical protein
VVVAALSLGGFVGVLLSGGFVYWEVGRYAAPQVPTTLFDERRELFAYTAGLFVGVPIAVAYLLFVTALGNGALPGALLFLALLVGGGELAQIFLLRTRYWGTGASGPFYALGFRAAIGGIVALALVAAYLGGPTIGALGLSATLLDAVAVVGLEVATSLLSVRVGGSSARREGGPWSGLLLGLVGFFLLGLGPLGGVVTELGAPLVAILGAVLAYARRRPILEEVPPPTGGVGPRPAEALGSYGRTSGSPANPSPSGEPLAREPGP